MDGVVTHSVQTDRSAEPAIGVDRMVSAGGVGLRVNVDMERALPETTGGGTLSNSGRFERSKYVIYILFAVVDIGALQ